MVIEKRDFPLWGVHIKKRLRNIPDKCVVKYSDILKTGHLNSISGLRFTTILTLLSHSLADNFQFSNEKLSSKENCDN